MYTDRSVYFPNVQGQVGVLPWETFQEQPWLSSYSTVLTLPDGDTDEHLVAGLAGWFCVNLPRPQSPQSYSQTIA